jgi:pSer/pThr/pTyr-binding forkhead associated (FHA) protein
MLWRDLVTNTRELPGLEWFKRNFPRPALVYTLPDSSEFSWDEATADTPDRIRRPTIRPTRDNDSTRIDLQHVTIPFDLPRSEVVFLTKDTTLIGRNRKDRTVDINFPMLQVSKRHAIIQRVGVDDLVGEVWTLSDQGSRNGTVLNGHSVAPGHIHGLKDMDVMVFGRIRAGFYLPESVWALLRNITDLRKGF